MSNKAWQNSKEDGSLVKLQNLERQLNRSTRAWFLYALYKQIDKFLVKKK